MFVKNACSLQERHCPGLQLKANTDRYFCKRWGNGCIEDIIHNKLIKWKSSYLGTKGNMLLLIFI